MKSRIVGPLTLSGSSGSGSDTVQTIFHDASAQNIDAVSGAFVAFGAGDAIPAAVTSMQLSSSVGEPLQFRIAASAVAAGLLSVDDFVVNQGGGPLNFSIGFDIGDKIWVRSLSANTVDSGYVTAILFS